MIQKKYNDLSAEQLTFSKRRPQNEPKICMMLSKWVKGQCKVNESSLDEMSFESVLTGNRKWGKHPAEGWGVGGGEGEEQESSFWNRTLAATLGAEHEA